MPRPSIPPRGDDAMALAGPLTLLMDEMLDCYLEWGEDAAAVGQAFQRWSAAREGEKASRFAEYLVALDQEEYAASAYDEAAKRLDWSLPAGRGAGTNIGARSRHGVRPA